MLTSDHDDAVDDHDTNGDGFFTPDEKDDSWLFAADTNEAGQVTLALRKAPMSERRTLPDSSVVPVAASRSWPAPSASTMTVCLCMAKRFSR